MAGSHDDVSARLSEHADALIVADYNRNTGGRGGGPALVPVVPLRATKESNRTHDVLIFMEAVP